MKTKNIITLALVIGGFILIRNYLRRRGTVVEVTEVLGKETPTIVVDQPPETAALGTVAFTGAQASASF